MTEAQYLALLNRVSALEQHVNDLTTAVNRMVSMIEVQQLHTILETRIDDLQTNVEALETRVTAIEEEPLT